MNMKTIFEKLGEKHNLKRKKERYERKEKKEEKRKIKKEI